MYTSYKPRTHDLERFDKLCRLHVHELARVFPRSTPEEERRFDLLRRAYVDARYDPAYSITLEDLEYLAGRVRELKAVTEDSCRKKIESMSS